MKVIIINKFLIDTLNNKDKFSLNTFLKFSNQLKYIRYIKINSNIFTYIYKKKNLKYYFKFDFLNKNLLKKIFWKIRFFNWWKRNYQIYIKGIFEDNGKNIEKIIEKENINLFNIN